MKYKRFMSLAMVGLGIVMILLTVASVSAEETQRGQEQIVSIKVVAHEIAAEKIDIDGSIIIAPAPTELAVAPNPMTYVNEKEVSGESVPSEFSSSQENGGEEKVEGTSMTAGIPVIGTLAVVGMLGVIDSRRKKI